MYHVGEFHLRMGSSLCQPSRGEESLWWHHPCLYVFRGDVKYHVYMEVSWNRGTPKSSTLFSVFMETPIWVWVNTYRYIFSGMNIHKSQLFRGSLGTRVLTHPHIMIIFTDLHGREVSHNRNLSSRTVTETPTGSGGVARRVSCWPLLWPPLIRWGDWHRNHGKDGWFIVDKILLKWTIWGSLHLDILVLFKDTPI